MTTAELTDLLDISPSEKLNYDQRVIQYVVAKKEKALFNFNFNKLLPKIQKKLLCFEYLCRHFYTWNEEALKQWKIENPTDSIKSELTKVKLFKLLFFTSAAKASKDTKDSGLLKIFYNFRAYPKGAVEQHVYLHMDGYMQPQNTDYCFDKNNVLQRSLTNQNKRQGVEERLTKLGVTIQDIRELDSSFSLLKTSNPFLVLLPNDAIVDLNHDCLSWLMPYSVGLVGKKSSNFLPIAKNGYVLSEPKYYLSDSYTRRLWDKYR